jgi:hypothetical protein
MYGVQAIQVRGGATAPSSPVPIRDTVCLSQCHALHPSLFLAPLDRCCGTLPWQPRRGQNGAARVNPSVIARHGHAWGLRRHQILVLPSIPCSRLMSALSCRRHRSRRHRNKPKVDARSLSLFYWLSFASFLTLRCPSLLMQDDCVLSKRARDVTHALAAEAAMWAPSLFSSVWMISWWLKTHSCWSFFWLICYLCPL